MDDMIQIRSVSFDTSFLLKENPSIDMVIKILAKEKIACFITSTVVSELEQLKIWGRIKPSVYKRAIRRWKNTHAIVIDFRNRLLSNAFGRACILSMEKHHGIKAEDIVNDCNILVSILKKGIDIFLSEDYHFTSKITRKVINEITNDACSEYHQMCDSIIYSIDTKTFLESYSHGKINLDIVKSRMKSIRKKGKL
jgi:rRNA-processing protein FCF1